MNAQEYADAVEAKIKELGWKEALKRLEVVPPEILDAEPPRLYRVGEEYLTIEEYDLRSRIDMNVAAIDAFREENAKYANRRARY